jgi:capsular polysaccharide biosynthesis protein
MKIKSRLPINITEENIHLFRAKKAYVLQPLKIKVLKNVFITHWGLILKNGLLPKKSAENLIGTYDHSFYFKHWKKAIEQFVVSKFGKSLPSIKLNDNQLYFTIHTPWFGYFSWLTTYLPRLIEVSHKYPKAILLVPEGWHSISFIQDTLKLFPNLEQQIIPNDHHVFVKQFVFTQTRPWTSIFYPEHLEQVRTLFLNELKNRNLNLSPIKKVYISRKKASRRQIINEIELENYLEREGFQSICFEDYSILEQIFIMQHAEIVVSMHGAGLTNAIFLNPKSRFLELSPEIQNPKLFRFPFWRIASILNIDYYIQFCKTINQGESDFYSRNIEVDLVQFKKNIVDLQKK